VHDEGVLGVHRRAADVGERCADTGELAQGDADLVDHLRAVRTEPPSPARGVRPPRGHLSGRIGEGGHVQDDRRQPRLADDSRRDRPGQGRLAGVPAELGAEQVDDTGALGRRQDVEGFSRIARERLLTQNVSTRIDRRERELGVRVRRGRDGDGVDTGQLECRGERRARVRHPESSGSLRRTRVIPSDDRDHVEAGRPQRPHVGDATETGADHDRAERVVSTHLTHRWKPSAARRQPDEWRRAPP
jgi:hypothetical protein